MTQPEIRRSSPIGFKDGKTSLDDQSFDRLMAKWSLRMNGNEAETPKPPSPEPSPERVDVTPRVTSPVRHSYRSPVREAHRSSEHAALPPRSTVSPIMANAEHIDGLLHRIDTMKVSSHLQSHHAPSPPPTRPRDVIEPEAQPARPPTLISVDHTGLFFASTDRNPPVVKRVLRIHNNTDRRAVPVSLSITQRSGMRFSTDHMTFSVDRTSISLGPDETAPITVTWRPKTPLLAERPKHFLSMAKLVIQGERAYQVPLTGVVGCPAVSLVRSTLVRSQGGWIGSATVANTGTCPAHIEYAPGIDPGPRSRVTVLYPGREVSLEVEAPEAPAGLLPLRLTVTSDPIRALHVQQTQGDGDAELAGAVPFEPLERWVAGTRSTVEFTLMAE